MPGFDLRRRLRRKRSGPACWSRPWSAPASWPRPDEGRRARAARQHAADRRDPGGADHDPRAGFGRAFQSGGDAGVCAAARAAGARARCSYVVAQIVGGIAGHMAAHAMFALPLLDAFAEGAHRRRRNGLPKASRLRPGRDHPGRHPLRARCGAVAGRPLHHRRPTGSPRRPRSPIRPWRSRARSPIPFPEFAPSICRASSRPNSSARSSAWS